MLREDVLGVLGCILSQYSFSASVLVEVGSRSFAVVSVRGDGSMNWLALEWR